MIWKLAAHLYISNLFQGDHYYLTVMDIATGTVIANNLIPLDSSDNIQSIAYDNIKGKLYGIQWDNDTTHMTTPTSIKTLDAQSGIKLYPNPANNSLHVESPTELGTITIYTALGRLALHLESKNREEQIDISKLANGVYFLEVYGNQYKIIKNN